MEGHGASLGLNYRAYLALLVIITSAMRHSRALGAISVKLAGVETSHALGQTILPLPLPPETAGRSIAERNHNMENVGARSAFTG